MLNTCVYTALFIPTRATGYHTLYPHHHGQVVFAKHVQTTE
jgi:hypothetical protein